MFWPHHSWSLDLNRQLGYLDFKKNWAWMKMVFISKIKWIALFVLMLSMVSLVVHLSITRLSGAYSMQSTLMPFNGFDFTASIFAPQSDRFVRNMKLWGPVMSLKSLQPYANPRSNYPGNGFWWNCLFLCLHFYFFYLQWCGFLNWYFSMMSFFWLVASCCGIWKCDMDLINVLYRSVFKWTVD